MSTPTGTITQADPQPSAATLNPEVRLPPAEIDASCRWPLLLLFTSSLLWLILALIFLLIASIKLHGPGFLAGSAWLTFGRIRPAGMDALLYGFASQAAMGVMLWMFCRLGGNRLLLPVVACVGTALWNLGVTLGVVAILAGYSTGFYWLEIPGSVSLLLLGAYALIGASAGVSFHFRRERNLYVSQWYLLAALFWFPWIFSAANLLLLFYPVRGTVQSIVNAWYANNLLGLWLGPVALATIYYFIPKLTERPLYNWWLAVFGFWTLAFFMNWSGLTSLVGGPVPAWLTSASIAANVLLLVPLLASTLNWHLTLHGAYRKVKEDFTLRYIAFSAGAYLIGTLAGIILALREVSVYTNFTYTDLAQTQLALFGFVGMALLGAMHYIIPRLLGEAWPVKNARFHFWSTAGAITLIFVALSLGGIIQAIKFNDPLIPFVNVSKATIPFVGMATLGWLVLLGAQAVFLAHLLAELVRSARTVGQNTWSVLGRPLHTPEVRP